MPATLDGDLGHPGQRRQSEEQQAVTLDPGDVLRLPDPDEVVEVLDVHRMAGDLFHVAA